MTYEMAPDGRSFTMTRHIAAPRPAVFAAWTQPDRLHWFSDAPEGVDDEASVDLRPGGSWRVHLYEGGGSTRHYHTGGVYTEVVPDELLAFAWGAVGGWPDLDPDRLDAVPLVTVSLRDEVLDDGTPGTEMTVRVGFADSVPANEMARWFGLGIRGGWSDTIDRLAPSLA